VASCAVGCAGIKPRIKPRSARAPGVCFCFGRRGRCALCAQTTLRAIFLRDSVFRVLGRSYGSLQTHVFTGIPWSQPLRSRAFFCAFSSRRTQPRTLRAPATDSFVYCIVLVDVSVLEEQFAVFGSQRG
jgi:hypothetical protein